MKAQPGILQMPQSPQMVSAECFQPLISYSTLSLSLPPSPFTSACYIHVINYLFNTKHVAIIDHVDDFSSGRHRTWPYMTSPLRSVCCSLPLTHVIPWVPESSRGPSLLRAFALAAPPAWKFFPTLQVWPVPSESLLPASLPAILLTWSIHSTGMGMWRL